MDCDRSCSRGCGCINIVISVVLAIVVGVLFFFRLIPGIAIAIWVVLALAILNLIFLIAALFIASSEHKHSALTKCLCSHGICFLVGIIGTIVLCLVAISIPLIPTLIPVVIIVAIGTFFAAFMATQLIALVRCIICRLCSRGYGED